jgi:hypothetical protein
MMDMDMNARLTRIDNLPPNPNHPSILRPLSLSANFEELDNDLDVILPIDQLLGGIGTPVVLRIGV